MEKYIFLLIVLSMLVFCLCTFPVFTYQAEQTYVITDKDYIADFVLPKSEKWQTNNYYVYKVSKAEENLIKKIPSGNVIKEYTLKNNHSINISNPFMQAVSSGNVTVFGLPYVID